MGFSGGGGGVLTNHTHDSLLTNDGGSLAANATQFGLSNQSLLVSDGTNIQEVLVGNESDNLSVSGGNIAWAASGGGIWEFVEEFVNASTQVYFTCTFASAISLADYNVRVDWFLKNDTISSMEMRVNAFNSYLINGAAAAGTLPINTATTIPADSWSIGSFVYYGNDVDNTRTMGLMDATSGDSAGGETFGVRWNPTFVLNQATSEINAVRFNPGSGDIYINSYCRVYRMAVN